MFEQSLYDKYEAETVATPTRDGDLFHDYEIKNWVLSPRIYKIVGLAALANVFALFVFAQTSLLTLKGCDSPLVGRVCQVLDTVVVGSMLFGTDREYVDAVYDKTELGDAEITFVDVSGETPPLNYPEGYFQIANPIEYQAMLDAPADMGFTSDIPGIPNGIPITKPSTGGSILDTTPNFPSTNPNVVDGDLPSFGGSTRSQVNPPVARKRPRSGRVTIPKPKMDDVNPVEPNDETVAEVKPTPAASPIPTETVAAVEINKKPLTDFADVVVAKWDAKEIDLNQPFTLVLNGVLTNDGKLDRQKSKFDTTKQKGDQKMIDVAKAALEAVGDSGFMSYLKNLNVEKVTVTLVQDDKQITALISSAQKTPELANTISTGLRNAISFGKIAAKNPSDERTLLDGATVTSDGKNFVLNFAIPKPVAQEMITRKLKEAQAKKLQQPQPNGNSITKSDGSTAKR